MRTTVEEKDIRITVEWFDGSYPAYDTILRLFEQAVLGTGHPYLTAVKTQKAIEYLNDEIEGLHGLKHWHIAFKEREKKFTNLEVRDILRRIRNRCESGDESTPQGKEADRK